MAWLQLQKKILSGFSWSFNKYVFDDSYFAPSEVTNRSLVDDQSDAKIESINVTTGSLHSTQSGINKRDIIDINLPSTSKASHNRPESLKRFVSPEIKPYPNQGRQSKIFDRHSRKNVDRRTNSKEKVRLKRDLEGNSKGAQKKQTDKRKTIPTQKKVKEETEKVEIDFSDNEDEEDERRKHRRLASMSQM